MKSTNHRVTITMTRDSIGKPWKTVMQSSVKIGKTTCRSKAQMNDFGTLLGSVAHDWVKNAENIMQGGAE